MDALLRDPCCVAGLTVVGLFAVGAIVAAAGHFVVGIFRRRGDPFRGDPSDADGEQETH